MPDTYITFRSITGAQRAERLLLPEGIRCTLMRAPKYLSVHGCGYAIHLSRDNVQRALWLLRRFAVPFSRVYQVGSDSRVEEVTV